MPNEQNELQEDCPRIVQSFRKLDRHAEQADQAAASLQNAARELDRKLDSEISGRAQADALLKARADEQAAGLEALTAASQAHGEGILGLAQSLAAETAKLDAADALLGADVQNRGIYNSKEILTVSGTWTAPVTGWYSVTLIGGGDPGVACRPSTTSTSGRRGHGGKSGAYLFSRPLYLTKGQQVLITIGAAGTGVSQTSGTYSLPYTQTAGGHTSFAGLSTADDAACRFPVNFSAGDYCYLTGSGFGGGSDGADACWYGGRGRHGSGKFPVQGGQRLPGLRNSLLV